MERRPATPDEARALANPLRLRILRLCLDTELTNEELATALDRDAGTVLHHVRFLVETGFLEPAPERRGRRGSTERPYRATGKSWTVDVGDSPSMTLAFADAFRAEVAESPSSEVPWSVRLATRLQREARESFEQRLQALIEELKDADDPAGEPYGFFAALHRRRDRTPPKG